MERSITMNMKRNVRKVFLNSKVFKETKIDERCRKMVFDEIKRNTDRNTKEERATAKKQKIYFTRYSKWNKQFYLRINRNKLIEMNRSNEFNNC